MPFTFKLSKRLALMRASTLALTAAAVFACEPGDQLPSAPLTAVLTATSPGTVSDLRVTAANDTSVTLAFTEVDDGTGLPASYDIRLLVGAISWGSAADVVRGSCATPVVGASIGSTHSCVVLGLAASTTYNFQLVAFRGTLNVTPVFGECLIVTNARAAQRLNVQPRARRRTPLRFRLISRGATGGCKRLLN